MSANERPTRQVRMDFYRQFGNSWTARGNRYYEPSPVIGTQDDSSTHIREPYFGVTISDQDFSDERKRSKFASALADELKEEGYRVRWANRIRIAIFRGDFQITRRTDLVDVPDRELLSIGQFGYMALHDLRGLLQDPTKFKPKLPS